MHPRICVSVMEKTGRGTVRSIRLLEQHDPDFIEIRFDSMKPPFSFSQIRDATSRRLVAANRSKANGGLFNGTEEARLQTLVCAAQEGFDYADLELEAMDIIGSVRKIRKTGAKSIVSYHNLKRTPSRRVLDAILAREKHARADVCKIVATARNYGDNLRCLSFVEKHAKRTRLVCFCMGRIGIPSRILSPIVGGYFTFASTHAGRETAIGQIPIGELRSLYKELALT